MDPTSHASGRVRHWPVTEQTATAHDPRRPAARATDGSAPARPRCGPSRSTTSPAWAPRVLGTSHRQAPVSNLVGAVREGLSDLFSLPEGYEVVLGNGGSTAFWDIAAFGLVRERAQHLAFGEFSAKFATVTQNAPFLGDSTVIKADPGTLRRAAGRGRRRRLRVAAQRDLDRRHGPGPAGRGRGRRRAGARRRHLRRRRPAGRRQPRPTSTTSAPQKCFAADGGLWLAPSPPRRWPASTRSPPRAAGSPTSSASRRRSTTRRLNQTYNTPAVGTLALLAQPGRLAQRPGRPRLGRQAHRRLLGPALRLGRAHRLRPPRTSPTRPPARRSSRRSTSPTRSTPRAVAKTLRAHGVVDVEPYRKLGRNQLRVATFPAVEPDDVSALIACIEHVVG